MYPASRPPLERMLKIDQELRARRWPNLGGLAARLEVGRRTIQRDIVFMRDRLRAPIEYDSVRHGYCYGEPTYRLPPFQITEGELIALYLAERMLRQFRGTPFEPNLKSAIKKLGDVLSDCVSVKLDAIGDFLAVLPEVQWSYQPELFCALASAVAQRRQVEMVYWTGGRKATAPRRFDAYKLALFDEGWYALGYCHLRRAVRMFAIGRIKSLSETGETFDAPADFRVEDYMQGSFRLIRGDGDHHVVLRFAPEAAGWIAERIWHSSQVAEPQSDGGLIVRFHVNDLRELKRWVMSWGGDCQVLQPPELRKLIVQEVRDILRRERSSKRREATHRPT
jgi:predicted DNA-binding transcriptional regulator YafY